MPVFPTIEEGRVVDETHDEDIVVRGKIDNYCNVTLVSRRGSITITDKIDNHCNVTLIAAGDVQIGTEGDPAGHRKIDNRCNVKVEAGGSITLGNRINNNCNVDLTAGGSVTIADILDDNSRLVIESGGAVSIGGRIYNSSVLELRAVDDVLIGGKIEGNCSATIDTLRGGIEIVEKIDNNSTVYLSAADSIRIGTRGGGSDRHINNNCRVFANCGGRITVGDKLGDDCLIRFRACGNITIESVVERGCQAFFETREGRTISVRRIRDSNTSVTFFGGRLVEAEGRHQEPRVENAQWIDAPLFCAGREITGEWWQNWGWKYGYVAQKIVPESLEELTAYVASLRADHRTKAVGGGWSFTDASLPFDTAEAVDNVSIEKRGIGGQQPIRRLLEGAPGSRTTFPFDHQPGNVVRARRVATTWSPTRQTNEVRSGFHLPAGPPNTSIIDIGRLASSLQERLPGLLSRHARNAIQAGRHFFHVEAGITIADLNTLLDHQKPRLAIQSSGAAQDATLAGVLSTATHGGEFNWPLLVDRVKAIHLVGPGGTQWWLEGEESIADRSELLRAYPGITREHFVAGDWTHEECSVRYTAEDVLHAVTVSMGTVGVIYSVVLEVVPAFGIRQKVKRFDSWTELLSRVDVTETQLRNRNAEANLRVLELLFDGERNGTGIPRRENIYVDLALNPINLKCWVTNRQMTAGIPREPKDLDLSIGAYLASFRKELKNDVGGSIFGALNDELIARVMDFLNYGRSIPDVVNDFEQAGRLVTFVLNRPPLLATVLSVVSGQVGINEDFRREPGRKRSFFGDILTGLLNILMGTVTEDTSDITNLSYKVGAIGWTDDGLPGKGCEIALPAEEAFSFLQSGILDYLALSTSPPLIGYISIRVCPPTKTFLGMEQFADYSVMIEPVAFRTENQQALFASIQSALADWNSRYRAHGMLHWGLENDLLTRARFENSAVTRSYRDGSPITKLVAFKAIRSMIRGDHAAVFDNHFVKRLGLDDYTCELRRVTATRKEILRPSTASSARRVNITGLCNSDAPWRFVTEAQAVQDIRSRGIRYFVDAGGERVFIHVVSGPTGPYLRTAPNDTEADNLVSLPNC